MMSPTFNSSKTTGRTSTNAPSGMAGCMLRPRPGMTTRPRRRIVSMTHAGKSCLASAMLGLLLAEGDDRCPRKAVGQDFAERTAVGRSGHAHRSPLAQPVTVSVAFALENKRTILAALHRK